MKRERMFERVLESLQEAALDVHQWPAVSRVLDEACGVVGNSLYIGEGYGSDARILFAGLYFRGQRHEELEREYARLYYRRDERPPRIRELPDAKLVHIHDVYTAQELKTSPTYNELVRRADGQNGLHVRLDGLYGTRIVWTLHDPVGRDGWGSEQVAMVERIVPHLRQLVRYRQALARTEALELSLTKLCDNSEVGVVHLDRRGRILQASDHAAAVLRGSNGLSDSHGFLHAWLPADEARLQRLVARALPTTVGQQASGSMMVRGPCGLPGVVAHVSPVPVHLLDFGAPDVGAVVLVIEPDRQPKPDAEVVAAALNLTPAQSRVAVLLATGRTVSDIASAIGRGQSTVRSHLKAIHRRLGISRRAELAGLVYSVGKMLARGPGGAGEGPVAGGGDAGDGADGA